MGARRFSSHNIETLRQLTKKVLAIEGPLSPKAWMGAETAFDMWTCHPVTQEGAEWGWRILDRLVEEDRQNNQQRLTEGWLHRMMGVYVENELPVDPDQVLAKIRGYAPVLNLDEKTLIMLQGMEKRTADIDNQENPINLSSSESVETFETSASDINKEEKSTEPPTSEPLSRDLEAPIEPAAPKQTPIEFMSTDEWEKAERTLSELSGREAFNLLDRLVKEQPGRQKVTTERLNRVVQAWCDKRMMEPTELLVKLSDYAPLPDASTYDIVVTTIQKTNFLDRPAGSMTKVDWNEAEARLRSLTSESATLASISTAWKILDRLVEEERHGKEQSSAYKSRLGPDWLNRIVEAWCGCPKMSSTKEPAEVLVRMNRYAPYLSPDPHIYQMIVDTVAKMNQPSDKNENSKEQTTNTRKMNNPSKHVTAKNTKTTMKLSRLVYHKRIQKLIPDGRIPAETNPEKAEAILDEMWELYHAGNLSVKPNTITYNIVLKAWVQSRRRQSGERAEALLERMQELNNAGDDTVIPDSITITTVMAAWFKSGHPAAATKVEALFGLMHQMYEAGDNSMKPDTYAYTALLNAISKSNNSDAGDRAEAILRQMQELYDNGDIGVKPDTTVYNMVMKACTHSLGVNRGERAERAEAMLNLMQEQYEAGNESVKPNFVSYNTIITAWSRCHEISKAGDRADNILRRMEAVFEAGDVTVKPVRHTYNGVISAYARSGDESAPEKAEMVLDRLVKLGDTSVTPNEISFNMVIAAYARQGSALRAEALLHRMHELQRSDSMPNAITYAKMVVAWLNSKDENAAENAIIYLEKLKKEIKGAGWKQEFESAYENVLRFLLEKEHDDNAPKLEELRQRLQKLRPDKTKNDEGMIEKNSSEDGDVISTELPRSVDDDASATSSKALSTSIASG